ncbi:glycosyltransferase [Sphingomonas sp. MA1305]|nr:glycosyltransferase [Sphingomonas sp. MA1305]
MADVGIVLIGRNEGERLIACLRSIAPLGLPIIYVDSASTDGSQAAARSAGAQVWDLDLAQPFTAARARHEGAMALIAAHPALRYIQFIDGDCALAPGWIAAARHFLEAAPDYAVACGRRRERRLEASLYNRLADIEWDTPIGDAAACGGDSLVRITAYQAVGGFDPTLIAGEEPELCARLGRAGWRIRRLDETMTIHDAAMTHLAQYWRRAVRSGFGYAQAWQTTRAHPHPLYRRELLRAGGWTLIPLGLAIVGGLAIHPALWWLAPAIYAAQIARLAGRFGAGARASWQRAALLTLAKAAETWGALRYVARAARGRAGGTILYK